MTMIEAKSTDVSSEYSYDNPTIDSSKQKAILWNQEYSNLNPLDQAAQYAFLKEHLGSIGGSSWISRSFTCDNGKNIFIGSNFVGNSNLTILDVEKVQIGDNVTISPNVLITTVNHPKSPMKRRKHLGIAKPVTIGDDVWIGGNATILPGITIGNNVIVGAGAVVAEDIPDNTVVAGVPAKKIGDLEDDVPDRE